MSGFGAALAAIFFPPINVQTAVNKIVNESLSETLISFAKTCAITSTQDMEIVIEGDTRVSDTIFGQYARIDLECIAENVTDVQVQNKFADTVAAKLGSSNSGLGASGINVSTNVTESLNKLKNSFGMQDVQSCLTANTQKYKVIIRGKAYVTGSQFIQSTDITASCVMQSEVRQKAITDLATTVKSELDSQNKGISSTSLIIMAIVVLVLGVIAFRIFMKMTK